MFTCSIGIMVYNEEKNIASLLNTLLDQHPSNCIINEIVVVASGCTDGTVEIVKKYIKKDKKIKLLKQERREGKASAVNYFLAHAKSDIIVLESGDTIPVKHAIEKLVERFKDPKVGMVGGHPIPVMLKNAYMGFTVNLLWHLHHRIALVNPKCGELVAFRNIIKKIPISSVDEACIEAVILEAGYELQYEPEAIVWNKGPDTISDFITQRRRIAAGHQYLKKIKGYSVSTKSPVRILIVLFNESFKRFLWTFCTIALEAYARFLGRMDVLFKGDKHKIWKIAESTKQEIKHVQD
jgi:biofilm PGA synthesis N-glycosyltransferase PgaC